MKKISLLFMFSVLCLGIFLTTSLSQAMAGKAPAPVSSTKDNTISNLSVAVKSTEATISWDTSTASESMISYLIKNDSVSDAEQAGDESISLKHSVLLTNLKPSTTYQYLITNSTNTDYKEFTTTAKTVVSNTNSNPKISDTAISKNLEKIRNTNQAIKLPEINSNNLKKYGDARKSLTELQNELNKVKTNSGIDAKIKLISNVSEQKSLKNLVLKYNTHFNNLSSNIDELNNELTELIETLKPISTQVIPPSIKKILNSEIQDFRTQIKELSDFNASNMQILDWETL